MLNQEIETRMKTPISLEAWKAEGVRRFGARIEDWKFQCPSCGHVQSIGDFLALGLDPNVAYFNCIGRHDGKHGHVVMGSKPGPCNYTGGGLFNLNPVAVVHPDSSEQTYVFAFADQTKEDVSGETIS